MGKESITDIARYNRVIILNWSELGYLLIVIDPEEACNIFYLESESYELYGNEML